jgi:hypothetical protein
MEERFFGNSLGLFVWQPGDLHRETTPRVAGEITD